MISANKKYNKRNTPIPTPIHIRLHSHSHTHILAASIQSGGNSEESERVGALKSMLQKKSSDCRAARPT